MAAAAPWRDDPETMPGRVGRCPLCAAAFTPTGRQQYCSSPCRKRAFRRRRGLASTAAVPARTGRREHTVYECVDCGTRQLGTQRCADCGTFGRSAGLGGDCPCCQEPVTLADLGLDQIDTATGATR